jgi:subtilisin
MPRPLDFVSGRAGALPSTRLARPKHALAAACFFGLLLVAVSLAAVRSHAASSPFTLPHVADLIAKAQQNGSVRIIVGLATSFQAEGTLAGPVSVFNQRGEIQAAQDAVLRELAASNATLLAKFKYIPYMALEVDAGALLQLAALPETTTFQEDVPEAADLVSSIPVIGADDAWLAGYTGSDQAVAIIDSGVDKTHSFFTTGGTKVVSEACYSTNNALFTSSSVCPGGISESTAAGSGIDCVAAASGYPTAQQHCKHGTHVAGIAAGEDGGAGIGVARDADIIAIQVFSLFTDPTLCGTSGGCALAWTSDQIKGMERVYELRNDFDIAAVNMSLGGAIKYTSPCDVLEAGRKAAIDNLLSAGIATVIASGNNSWVDGVASPGCISSAVTVGATDDSDNIAWFSNVDSFLDLLAPGVDIVSAVPGGSTESKNGTSMATPHVTGAWAVIKGKAPSASVAEVLAALRDTGTSVDDGRLGASLTDMRRINLGQALAQFQPVLTITKTIELVNDPARPGDPVTYTIVVANLSDATAAGVILTDTLPTYVVGADLDTALTIAAGDRVTYTLPTTVAEDAPHGVTITNTAYYSHTSGSGESSAAFSIPGWFTYLPLVQK